MILRTHYAPVTVPAVRGVRLLLASLLGRATLRFTPQIVPLRKRKLGSRHFCWDRLPAT